MDKPRKVMVKSANRYKLNWHRDKGMDKWLHTKRVGCNNSSMLEVWKRLSYTAVDGRAWVGNYMLHKTNDVIIIRL